MPNDTIPLAARMRPRSIDEMVGQAHLFGEGQPFRSAVDAGRIPSLLLWGPPGCGKTTLARLLAAEAGLKFLQISAVMSGIKTLRIIIQQATDTKKLEARGSLLFIDEIHRWNKAQQDALLPHVEEGTVVLVGATTENPGFQIIPALRSRCWLLTLQALAETDIKNVLERTLADSERGLAQEEYQFDGEGLLAIARASAGDARRALSFLERFTAGMAPKSIATLEAITTALGRPDLLHDKDGDMHFDVASAFIKSMRGSNPDGSLYWMARLLEGGEDPMFVARRMVIFASEDIGNADPRALQLAVNAMQGVHLIGMPEARILLGQAVAYLATSPKSNATYKATDAAIAAVRKTGPLPVPLHLRNAPTQIAKSAGHGEHYKYPHDFPDHIVQQTYLPKQIQGLRFYHPTAQGTEKTIRDRMDWWRNRLIARPKK